MEPSPKWRDKDGIIHIVYWSGNAYWPICYSKRHTKHSTDLIDSEEIPTCLWCVATDGRRYDT